jgi:hypothetical protein
MKAVLSEEQIKPIKDEINSIQNDFDNASKHNNSLAGNIEKEYKLKNSYSYIESLLLPLAQAYMGANSYKKYLLSIQSKYTNSKDELVNIRLSDAWVNFQSKHEFNPIHSHSGFLSFVIWIDIPFLIDDESKQSHVKDSNAKLGGKFCFMYTDILGNISSHSIGADKSYNNGLLLFPAELLHTVYPFFTSDKQRISVAGNFGITNES